MDPESAKLIATAVAALPVAGVGVALGMIFSSYNTSVARNPSAREDLDKKFFLCFALTEALAIFVIGLGLLIFFMG
ncbi:MAG TPA: F0F1 ATP synthase subunit C [Rhodospirillaceae bacterium]|jgi:F0F1-type ATP synthase membrane subunit c/vacuolar-type H+-ATPase subunit K|nr:F0F1 ATP synthase subunit C [Alphaproteobacteria bacterium]HBH26828.1 F0F1 ATP synthase subunit C [Rhodospirillaceae bacterium]